MTQKTILTLLTSITHCEAYMLVPTRTRWLSEPYIMTVPGSGGEFSNSSRAMSESSNRLEFSNLTILTQSPLSEGRQAG